jgi:hypothetical protein
MKLLQPRLGVFAFIIAMAVAAEPSPPRAVPQPRVRLQPTAEGSVAKVGKEESAPAPVVLEKVVVAESKLPLNQPDAVPWDPKEFTASGGGTLTTGKVGEAPYAIGFWRRFDLFWQDARFKPPKTHVDIEVVRVKL